MSLRTRPLRTCAHTLSGGTCCRAAAQRHGRYCRAHQISRLRSRKIARATRRVRCLRFEHPADAGAIARNTVRVRYAAASGRMSPSAARLALYAFQFAARLDRASKPRPHHGKRRAQPTPTPSPNSLQLNRIAISAYESRRYMQYVPQIIEITRTLGGARRTLSREIRTGFTPEPTNLERGDFRPGNEEICRQQHQQRAVDAQHQGSAK